MFWIDLNQVYDIAFCKRDTIKVARHRKILDETDPEGVDTTVYVPRDWKMEDENIEPGANDSIAAAVLLM